MWLRGSRGDSGKLIPPPKKVEGIETQMLQICDHLEHGICWNRHHRIKLKLIFPIDFPVKVDLPFCFANGKHTEIKTSKSPFANRCGEPPERRCPPCFAPKVGLTWRWKRWPCGPGEGRSTGWSQWLQPLPSNEQSEMENIVILKR